ncbi:hypothetical protein A2W24_05700 [Microgenomates group bacterium RBG_16_45_19]|nr:MAG: hypothetical protein A2W24_05700 [Microgenomates group bacterium RBG_16_45_19]
MSTPKIHLTSNWLFSLGCLTILSLFLALRLYRLPQSLLFFNDMGRDFLELYEWQTTGLPPLLGPQTSVISFNQSAVYFYLLYPFYRLTGASDLASVYALLTTAVVVFFIGVIYAFNHPLERRRFLVTAFILVIHPLVVTQNRFIWNPSFVPYFLTAALFVYPRLLHPRPPRGLIHWYAALVTLAVSFNYSALPVVLASVLYGCWIWRRSAGKILGWLAAYVLLWNLPTLLFEIRHQFALSYLFLIGQRTGLVSQSALTKLSALFTYLGAAPSLAVWLIGVLLLVCIFFTWRFPAASPVRTYLVLLIIALVITILLPVAVEAHYLFGFISLLSLLIANLPLPVAAVITLVLALTWLRPPLFTGYFKPVVRTLADLNRCYQTFCATHQQPLYVSMQSGLLPYHNAPEHRYFMLKAGCQALNIAQHQDQAQTMVVVADDSTYEHGQTAYHELTLFGPSREVEVFTCQDNLRLHLLEKL